MIFRPSGGLLYHLRAWRERRNWRGFAQDLERWLADWNPPRAHLMLVGPSAGYTLPTNWLRDFARITAYDLDPLAPKLFARNHPGVNVSFHRADAFGRGRALSLVPLREALFEHPDATVLFSNVLGQLLLEKKASETEWLTFLGDLRKLLADRAWASYHDLFTHERGEVIDHLLDGDWKRGLASRRFTWALTARSRHEVEGVRPV